ncbi:MAG: TatD family hydrolase [Acidobacteria bacterium]|nr:TatD family hydrolase [Acidobacteriota bacterium]
MIDSHCHPDDNAFDADRDAMMERAQAAGITTILAIDPSPEFLDQYSCLLGSVGVHPHQAAETTPDTIPHLRQRARHPKVVAIGEIGLDYHYDFAPRDVQRRVFIDHLRLAAELSLPIIIHTREAWDDTFAVLEEHWQGTGIMHCFSGGPKEAERSVAMGFHLAFGGVITFPKALEVQEAARWAPADRILLETDAPYLAPVPKRGKRNEPALMVHTAARLAELRGTTVAEIERQTTANFQQLFSAAFGGRITLGVPG